MQRPARFTGGCISACCDRNQAESKGGMGSIPGQAASRRRRYDAAGGSFSVNDRRCIDIRLRRRITYVECSGKNCRIPRLRSPAVSCIIQLKHNIALKRQRIREESGDYVKTHYRTHRIVMFTRKPGCTQCFAGDAQRSM